jgi:hypothetical protein
MVNQQKEVPQPLISLIWDRYLAEIQAPDTDHMDRYLYGLNKVMAEAGVAETDDVDSRWLLLRTVDPKMLRDACCRILQTHNATMAFQTCLVLIRFLGWVELVPAIRTALDEERCDSGDQLEALYSLMSLGAVTDEDRERVLRAIFPEEESSDPQPENSRWLALAARILAPEDRGRVAQHIRDFDASLPESSSSIAALAEMVSRGEDMTKPLRLLSQEALLGTKVFSHRLPSLDALLFQTGVDLPLERWLGPEDDIMDDSAEIVLRRLYASPDIARSQMGAIERTLDAIDQDGQSPPWQLVLAYISGGGDTGRLRIYMDSKDWEVRAAAYWALGADLDEDEAARRHGMEGDPDAELVLEFVRAEPIDQEILAYRLAESEYPVVLDPLSQFSPVPAGDDTTAGVLDRLRSDREIGTLALWESRVSDGVWLPGSEKWIGTDIQLWWARWLSLRSDLARVRSEALLVSAGDDDTFANAALAVVLSGGPQTAEGALMLRIASHERIRSLTEEEYAVLELWRSPTPGTRTKWLMQSLTAEILSRRPGLLREALLYGDNDLVRTAREAIQIRASQHGGDTRDIDSYRYQRKLKVTPYVVFEELLDTPDLTEGDTGLLWRHLLGGQGLPDFIGPSDAAARFAQIFIDRALDIPGMTLKKIIAILSYPLNRSGEHDTVRIAAQARSGVSSVILKEIAAFDPYAVWDHELLVQQFIQMFEPEAAGGVILVVRSGEYGLVLDEDDMDDVVERFATSTWSEERVAGYLGRHVVLQPALDLPERAGTMTADEFNGLVLHLGVDFVTEEDGSVAATVVAERSISLLNLLLKEHVMRTIVGWWL